MSRRIERLATPQGIGSGQTATLNLPLGPTYHRFDIRMTGSENADPIIDIPAADWATYIGDIRLIVDGDVKIEATAEYLMERAKYYGETLTNGVLPIFLSSPWARTMNGEDTTAYGTNGGMSSFTLEIDLKDPINIGTLRVYAEQSAVVPFGPHLRIQRFAKSFAVTGVDEISDLPRGAYNLIQLDITDANIGDVEVLANNNRMHVSDAAIRANQQLIAGRVAQAGRTHLDFMAQNRVNGTFPMVLQDFRLKLDFSSAPGAYNMYLTSLHGNG